MNLKTIILQAIQTINLDLKIDELRKIDDSTTLFELLDSLGTLDLILELESILQAQTGRYIAVGDEHSMDKDKTPFKTITTLQKYLQQKITDE